MLKLFKCKQRLFGANPACIQYEIPHYSSSPLFPLVLPAVFKMNRQSRRGIDLFH